MNKRVRNMLLPIVLLFATVFGILTFYSGSSSSFSIAELEGNAVSTPAAIGERMKGSYTTLLQQWNDAGYEKGSNKPVQLTVSEPSSSSEITQPAEDGKSIQLLKQQSWVEYAFQVTDSGQYELEMEYMPLEDTFAPVQIAVELDGKFLYKEAEYLMLDRVFHDAIYPPATNERGDQQRPLQVEDRAWRTVRLHDVKMAHSEPLRWLLTEGKHSLRIRLIQERVALKSISFAPVQALSSYDASKAAKRGTSNVSWQRTIEAEEMAAKSDPSVQSQPSNDDLAFPPSKGRVILNTLGGERWYRGGQWAEWTFDVPEDGWYDIYLKYLQDLNRDVTSYRSVSIDGKVPYKEWQQVAFPYTSDWTIRAIGDKGGNAYSVHLSKGSHTLRMTVQTAETTVIRERLLALQAELQQINHQIMMVSGVHDSQMIDNNRDWDITKYVPGLEVTFTGYAKLLYEQIAELQQLFGNNDGSTSLRSALYDLLDIAKDPNLIPRKPQMLGTIQETLATYVDTLTYQPVSLDQIYISAAGMKPEVQMSDWNDKLANDVSSFFRSFSSNYMYNGRSDKKSLTVWVNRGRDYVSQLQQLVDETFTPATGISVNINLMPNEQLLILSSSSDKQPDVALGISQNMPADLAMRNALVDVSQFPDYKQVASSFHPGSLIPLQYNGGVYGLPETIMFQMMFYRKDIFESLGLALPDTWEDVVKLLPSLQQRGMNFFYSPLGFLPFFLQNDANVYKPNGLSSGLDSRNGFKAFKQWTDLFNVYGFPKEVPNFYMHFRNGSLPIGIADINTYLQLSVAAPELTGSWGIAPLPGIKDENGDTRRWAGGSLQSGVIFKSSDRQEDAWTFLKWWLSDETQTRYGNDMELINGIEFRWNTANYNAFQKLPWPDEEKKAISKQWQWFQEMPNVPGGYFTQRELTFAWNRTVLNGENPHESLEKAIFEINRELERKQREFNFVDKNGHVLKTFRVPTLNKAWRGREEDDG
ncbi:ABC transporter substrate-binding protein [Paenibacillus baekrokdamisoli]|uniref:ABC transporter substrate-binding protein n=1 Tax=Paenibacillus baekrokdamisoli TaxID=1712516 RepID=A0A3G9IJB0_9BACL|nr:extracellular solute-binding protein [Paenibacillus baekrokdamisoli]MBB3072708.1 ABC-type glycerol-3-phosphate transport system substrate-binding protein [Paenibacillus baekrokdamisoli]BBH18990.1 ABC transporter substrate-binding protein [Paenibacillus baekrokdamisoli]